MCYLPPNVIVKVDEKKNDAGDVEMLDLCDNDFVQSLTIIDKGTFCLVIFYLIILKYTKILRYSSRN